LPAFSSSVILTAVRFGSVQPEQRPLINPTQWQFDCYQAVGCQRRRLALFDDRGHDAMHAKRRGQIG
jgi:hypothetical protein